MRQSCGVKVVEEVAQVAWRSCGGECTCHGGSSSVMAHDGHGRQSRGNDSGTRLTQTGQ